MLGSLHERHQQGAGETYSLAFTGVGRRASLPPLEESGLQPGEATSKGSFKVHLKIPSFLKRSSSLEQVKVGGILQPQAGRSVRACVRVRHEAPLRCYSPRPSHSKAGIDVSLTASPFPPSRVCGAGCCGQEPSQVPSWWPAASLSTLNSRPRHRVQTARLQGQPCCLFVNMAKAWGRSLTVQLTSVGIQLKVDKGRCQVHTRTPSNEASACPGRRVLAGSPRDGRRERRGGRPSSLAADSPAPRTGGSARTGPYYMDERGPRWHVVIRTCVSQQA